MKKRLEINLYADGFDATHLNCIDLPIAGALGYYDYNNYYYYCFYHCILNNWSKAENKDWLALRNNILQKLGLTLYPITIKDPSSFIPIIKSEIDKQHPLLMLVKYFYLFYHVGYLDDEYRHISHGIIINGYESEKSLVSIKEYAHIENDLKSLTKSYLLCDLVLTENIIQDVWTKSNTIFNQENTNNFNTLYSIQSIGKPQIKNYEDLFKDSLDNIDIGSDKLVELVRNFNSIYSNINKLSHVSQLRKTYVNSLGMLFDVFERAYSFLKQNQEKQSEYNNIKDKYLQTRSIILNRLIANALKCKIISEDTENDFISQIFSINNELFSFIRNLIKDKASINKNLSVYSFYLDEQAQVRDGQYANSIVDCAKLLIVQNFPEPDRNWEVFLKFNLSDLEFEKCSSAKLRLYCNYSQSPTPVEIYSVQDNLWTSNEITWNNRPTLNTNLAALQIVSMQKTWYSFDLTNLVNDKLASDKIVSLCLRVEPEANVGANFYTKYANTNQPVLEVKPIKSS